MSIIDPVGGYTTESVTHGKYATPDLYTVTLAIEHHRPLAGTKLYFLVTEAHVCEQLAQSRCMKVERSWLEPANS